MATPEESSAELQVLLDRLHAGDGRAVDDLVERSMLRLRRLAARYLRLQPEVHRWELTDDVLQNSLLRLRRALMDTRPASVRAFLGLAAVQIRRELVDLWRHHYGPHGDGAHHASDPQTPDSRGYIRPRVEAAAGRERAPLDQLESEELFEQIGRLPEKLREVFDLMYIQELNQAEIANLLSISIPTVKRRYREARLQLRRLLREDQHSD